MAIDILKYIHLRVYANFIADDAAAIYWLKSAGAGEHFTTHLHSTIIKNLELAVSTLGYTLTPIPPTAVTEAPEDDRPTPPAQPGDEPNRPGSLDEIPF